MLDNTDNLLNLNINSWGNFSHVATNHAVGSKRISSMIHRQIMLLQIKRDLLQFTGDSCYRKEINIGSESLRHAVVAADALRDFSYKKVLRWRSLSKKTATDRTFTSYMIYCIGLRRLPKANHVCCLSTFSASILFKSYLIVKV